MAESDIVGWGRGGGGVDPPIKQPLQHREY